MNIDIEAMKAAALAATPGEWHAPGLAELHDASNRVIACFSDVDPVMQEERPQPTVEEGDRNARFAALACPAAVLTLIERLERTERNRDMWKGQCERQTEVLTKLADTTNGFPDIKGDSLPTLRKRFSALYAIAWAKEHHLEAVQRDLDALRASANPDALESERQTNAMLTEENDRLQRKLETQTKPDRFSGLPFRPIIPEAVMRRCERPYAGPVNPGDVFAWEPDIDTARELLVVTRITKAPSFPEPYEERVFTRPIDGGKEVWNDMGRFREAVVPTLFRPWPVDA